MNRQLRGASCRNEPCKVCGRERICTAYEVQWKRFRLRQGCCEHVGIGSEREQAADPTILDNQNLESFIMATSGAGGGCFSMAGGSGAREPPEAPKDAAVAFTRRKDYPKRLCHNDLNYPQRLIFSRFSVIVDSFSRCGIVIYSSFSSSGLTGPRDCGEMPNISNMSKAGSVATILGEIDWRTRLDCIPSPIRTADAPDCLSC
jgi:hypothetical protein